MSEADFPMLSSASGPVGMPPSGNKKRSRRARGRRRPKPSSASKQRRTGQSTSTKHSAGTDDEADNGTADGTAAGARAGAGSAAPVTAIPGEPQSPLALAEAALVKALSQQREELATDLLSVVRDLTHIVVAGRVVYRKRIPSLERARVYASCIEVLRLALARCPCGWGKALGTPGAEVARRGSKASAEKVRAVLTKWAPRQDYSDSSLPRAPVCACESSPVLVESLALCLAELGYTQADVSRPQTAEAAYTESLYLLRHVLRLSEDEKVRSVGHGHAQALMLSIKFYTAWVA